MTTIQERLQIKREPLDKWSIREQLSLASAVAKSGDQNWMSVSRALKPFGDPNRPPDWFHQKNCASQYGSLLENVETPKRKKRTSGVETMVETPIEAILRRLTQERLVELDKVLAEEKAEYLRLQDEMDLLQSGNITDQQIDKWLKDIQDEEDRKEQEAIAHTQWLKEREQRKQEIERAWRPMQKPSALSLSVKRKSETVETVTEMEVEESPPPQPETPKPALSPLLTSLLKSPSQVPVSAQSTILHTVISNQRVNTPSSNPTIASLLNSSPTVTVSPGLQQLVSTAITKEPTGVDILQDTIDNLPNIKVEDLESSILSSDEPLPEIKNEEVEVIISDLIQNADIVSDPEQHLKLDDNEDIITNLDNELKELCQEEENAQALEAEKQKLKEENKTVDPFEFHEENEFELEDRNVKVVESEPVIAPPPPPPVQLEEEEIKQEPIKEDEPEEVIEPVEDKPEIIETETLPPSETEKETETENEFTENIFDDVAMEVNKLDKTGKAKRDYSRTKKKEDSFDILLSVDKVEKEDEVDEVFEKEFPESEAKLKVKSETDRSNSPWAEEDDIPVGKQKRRIPTPATPSDSGPGSPASSTMCLEDDRDYRVWKKSLLMLHNSICTNKYASVFEKPITNEQAPGYHSIVYRPMDLQTIRKNIDSGMIRTSLEFKRDILLMFANAIMFNKTDDLVYNMAKQMHQESMQEIKLFMEARQGDTSRRETRTSEPGIKRKRGGDDFRNTKKRKEDI